MQKALAGLMIAVALAVSASGATFFGIDAWKVVLALAGAVIFVMGATNPPKETTTTKNTNSSTDSR
jgi:hypothetical protein